MENKNREWGAQAFTRGQKKKEEREPDELAELTKREVEGQGGHCASMRERGSKGFWRACVSESTVRLSVRSGKQLGPDLVTPSSSSTVALCKESFSSTFVVSPPAFSLFPARRECVCVCIHTNKQVLKPGL